MPSRKASTRVLWFAIALGAQLVGCGRYNFVALDEEDTCTSCPDATVSACDCAMGCTEPQCDVECEDRDGDGFAAASCGGTDCDDDAFAIHPGAEGPVGSASCSDMVDNDCDDLVDASDLDCTAAAFEPMSSPVAPYYDPLRNNILTIGNTMFFAGETADGIELWKTDGTQAGTQLVKDIHAAGSSAPAHFTELGGELLFFADDGINGRELWASDGTTAGTRLVRDINPAGDSINFPEVVAIGDYIVFEANDGSSGRELWRSDGTSTGTTLLLDINPGPANGSPYEMHKLDANRAVFRAFDPVNGVELWVTDGFAANTQLIVDANPGTGNSLPDGWYRYFEDNNGFVYYRGTDGSNGLELWRTDGTAAGTTMVRDAIPGSGDGVYSNPWIAGASSKVFFGGSGPTSGNEPHVSDGSQAGTTLLADINPTGESLPPGANYYFFQYGANVFFRADDGVNGIELWVSNGTTEGTTQVKDISAVGGSDPKGFFIFKNQLFFRASDGAAGNELWTSDGTTAGTALVLDINPGGDSFPDFMGIVNDVAVFSADAGGGNRELWRGF